MQALVVLFCLVSVSQNLLDCDYIENILLSYNPLPLYAHKRPHTYHSHDVIHGHKELGNSEEIKLYEGGTLLPEKV